MPKRLAIRRRAHRLEVLGGKRVCGERFGLLAAPKEQASQIVAHAGLNQSSLLYAEQAGTSASGMSDIITAQAGSALLFAAAVTGWLVEVPGRVKRTFMLR